MLTLKAGFYIDEVNYKLQKLVGKDVFVNFLKNNIHFKASGLPLIIKPEKPSSLIKVAWNIITRGEPTRASLELSQGILSYHLKDYFIEIDNHEKNSETNVKIKKDFFNGIDKSELTELLENFGFWSEEDIVRFGTRLFSLYKVLHDLITSAQIQNCILLYLMDNEGEKTYSFSFHGINRLFGGKNYTGFEQLILCT